MPLAPATLELLAATPGAVRGLPTGLPVEAVDRPDAAGWSAHDIVAHLVDRGRIQRARVERLLATPGAVIEDTDEQVTLEASGLRAWALGTLMDQLSVARADDVLRYAALRPEELVIVGQHAVAGPSRLHTWFTSSPITTCSTSARPPRPSAQHSVQPAARSRSSTDAHRGKSVPDDPRRGVEGRPPPHRVGGHSTLRRKE